MGGTYGDDISIIESLASNRIKLLSNTSCSNQAVYIVRYCKCFLSTRAIFLLISFHGPFVIENKKQPRQKQSSPTLLIRGEGGPCQSLRFSL